MDIMNIYTLGINCSGFHSSACLVKDGKIIFAICEERLTKVKQDKSFPINAINYVCKAEKITLKDIKNIYIGWNPRFYLPKSDGSMLEAYRQRGKIAYFSLNELATINDKQELSNLKQVLIYDDHEIEIKYVDHHKAHLSNGFFSSNFESADFLILDGFGEKTTGFCGTIDYSGINILNEYTSPHSIGSFYSAFTDFLGFKPNSEEWKVMALSPMGNAKKYYDKVKKLIKIDDINFELDLSYFEHFLFFTKEYYTNKFSKEFDWLNNSEELTQDHYDLVAACQLVAEETTFSILNSLHNKTKLTNLVVGGGFFMNSVLNGKITEKTPYKNIFIGGSPDDSGISIGSALFGYYFDLSKTKKIKEALTHNYFGIEYSDEQIITELRRRKLKFKKVEKICYETAKLIYEGNIIGWFQGKSEFGQRALGNRSILANPCLPNIKDLVNSSIKYRESFRPFAPSIIKEKQNILFNDFNNQTSYFMEKVFNYKDSWEEKVPGTDHYGTGRLQTVDKDINPKYYQLIEELYKLTNVPCILNTSFNVNGMPVVETPSDAINCFYSSGIDYLIIGNYIIGK